MLAFRVTLRSMPGVAGDEGRDVADALLLQGQVGGDVPHGPALAQRGVVPLLRR